MRERARETGAERSGQRPGRGSERREREDRSRQTPDAAERELERRQSEAEREWRQDAGARREFGRDYGIQEHEDWAAEQRWAESAAGRVENKEYGIEMELRHPDGGKVRYDYVDLQNHRIVDRKPVAEGQTVHDLAREHAEQRTRHIEAYRAKYGVEPTYEYSPYPSSKRFYDSD